MNPPGQQSLESLPYYREYLDQILKPRVVRLIDEVRSNLASHAWNELLERLAEEQNPGASTDSAIIQKTRHLLEQTLGLRMGVLLDAEFAGEAANKSQQSSMNGSESPRRADTGEHRPQSEVVERGNFPDNPLARAMGGVRRIGR
jgi:hypothetical protein